MIKKRKIFFVIASGGQDTDRHYHETLKNKRRLDEAIRFLNDPEAAELKYVYHGQEFAVWGSVPGESNSRLWEKMEPGDYVMIYRKGYIIFAAEVAMKVRNKQYAQHLWREDRNGKTWELMYFLINEVEVRVKQSDLNKYLGYKESYFPQGFMAVQQETADRLLSMYGDLISFLQIIQSGHKPEEIEAPKTYEVIDELVEERVQRAPTVHDEMQWRLIRLGNRAHFDVWVPANDQGKQYDGNVFREHVISDFSEAIDIPLSIKNIDAVWKLGYSIKSAFEIEHSTAIYSGILRLSDLRAMAPNSNYPLFIVADRDRRSKVFEQVKRPTFANDYLRLDKIIKFLSYDKVRELDEKFKGSNAGFDIEWLTDQGETATI